MTYRARCMGREELRERVRLRRVTKIRTLWERRFPQFPGLWMQLYGLAHLRPYRMMRRLLLC